MAATPAHGPKRRRLEAASDVLSRVVGGEIGEGTLRARLEAHVERIDSDLALEYQMQLGLAGARARA